MKVLIDECIPGKLKLSLSGNPFLAFLILFLVLPVSAQPRLSQTAFPDVKNVRDVTIILQRGGGLGGGPSYKLLIPGDETVGYEGYAGVFTRGKRVGHIRNSAMNH
jgi:hypothetical protein